MPEAPPAGVEILSCPISRSDLHWVSDQDIDALNERIRAGSLRHTDGTTVTRPLTAALASAREEYVHRVEDGIFHLLASTAICGAPSATRPAVRELTTETKVVRRFYDEFGWRESSEGIFADALKFEDLRPVSRNYIRNCHLRLVNYLPPRGTYLLDAASGPVQYAEYHAYSANFDFRVCADVSEVALRSARKRVGEKGIYLLCDVTRLPLKDGVVDGFVSLHTIYHVAARQQQGAIAELHRVLKQPGSGVIVYSWGARSPLMNLLEGHARSRAAPAPARDEPPLFGHSHDYAWYLKNVERPYRTQLASWRSVSVPFLQRFAHDRALGRPLLALLHALEGWFPRWFGRYGQYPVFVFTK